MAAGGRPAPVSLDALTLNGLYWCDVPLTTGWAPIPAPADASPHSDAVRADHAGHAVHTAPADAILADAAVARHPETAPAMHPDPATAVPAAVPLKDVNDAASHVRVPVRVMGLRKDAAPPLVRLHPIGQDRRHDVWLPLTAMRRVAPLTDQETARALHADLRLTDPWGPPMPTPAPDRMDDSAASTDHPAVTNIRAITHVRYGPWRLRTWYWSPYPDVFQIAELVVCRACCLYFASAAALRAHHRHCRAAACGAPPGTCVYTASDVAVYRVRGDAEPLFCTSLALLAKLWIDQKERCYHVPLFDFYVLVRRPRRTRRRVRGQPPGGREPAVPLTVLGYFSRHRQHRTRCMSCLLVLPPFQHQGYAQLLIDLSYQLLVREGQSGVPEEPLSERGAAAFTAYWRRTLVRQLLALLGVLDADGALVGVPAALRADPAAPLTPDDLAALASHIAAHARPELRPAAHPMAAAAPPAGATARPRRSTSALDGGGAGRGAPPSVPAAGVGVRVGVALQDLAARTGIAPRTVGRTLAELGLLGLVPGAEGAGLAAAAEAETAAQQALAQAVAAQARQRVAPSRAAPRGARRAPARAEWAVDCVVAAATIAVHPAGAIAAQNTWSWHAADVSPSVALHVVRAIRLALAWDRPAGPPAETPAHITAAAAAAAAESTADPETPANSPPPLGGGSGHG